MKLTPLAKVFVTFVILAVVGISGYHYYGDRLKEWSKGASGTTGGGGTGSGSGSGSNNSVTKDDFGKLQNTPDPDRKNSVNGVASPTLGTGRLNRPLVIGINTWAGHAPGIIANGGLDQDPKSVYATKYKTAVKFVLIEDPQAKLAAFIKGDIDIMWDTCDSWAREASALAEQNGAGKAILQEDWSRGGDGIVSLKSIKSIEDLKGKVIATTRYTPSHWLLLYMLAQSGLTAEDKKQIEKNIVFTQEAPLAAAAFRSKKVDAAVTWEPDLSGAVKAREDEAYVLVSTAAATNVIADVLVARPDIIDKAPETLKDFVAGWFDGIDMIGTDPAGSYAAVGKALKLSPDDVSGMLSGLKLTPFADNAVFFGLAKDSHAQFNTLFDAAFVVWRKEGVVSKAVDAAASVDTRFVAALASKYQGQQVKEDFKFDPKDAKKPESRAIVNKTLSIYFTPGSDEVMRGSFFTLDSLGDTMTAFGNTFLRIEGNTDAIGSAKVNKTLSQRRADSVRAYLVKNFNIDAKRFQTIGHGAENPVAPNTTEAGRQENRRTDIKVVLNVQ